MRHQGAKVLACAAALAGAWTAMPDEAAAFCGFYVSGADGGMYNDATMVVLMRDGVRTVLAMKNTYKGPPQDFAMVVPVPVVLREGDVKTLPAEIFRRVDTLAAPRLVEYWEQDPCYVEPEIYYLQGSDITEDSPVVRRSKERPRDLGVTIEAQFAVGEYQIVILGANDSVGLDLWLRQNGYKIPEGAAAVLRPYVAAGMKFFVAKVDIDKAPFGSHGGRELSPLRFHYDSETFSLPVRLGLINTQGEQDLIVHILARETRYELANYRNVAIPTNLDVKAETAGQFASFYAALFDRTIGDGAAAVVTEYAWAAGSCDPCPEPPLTLAELVTLGADVLPSYEKALRGKKVPSTMTYEVPGQFVLTRLHSRYGPSNLGEDLVFQAAPPIQGGSGTPYAEQVLSREAVASGANAFQARYIIRHPWTGPVTCERPQYGKWGPPPRGSAPSMQVGRDLAFAARDEPLTEFLAEKTEPQALTMPAGPISLPAPQAYQVNEDDVPRSRGCGRCDAVGGSGWPGLLVVLGLRRRRRSRTQA